MTTREADADVRAERRRGGHEKVAARGRAAEGNRGDPNGQWGKRGLTPFKTIQPIPSTHSLQDGEPGSLTSRWA